MIRRTFLKLAGAAFAACYGLMPDLAAPEPGVQRAPFVAHSHILAGMVVVIDDGGWAYPALPSGLSNCAVIGIARRDARPCEPVDLVSQGAVTVLVDVGGATALPPPAPLRPGAHGCAPSNRPRYHRH